MNCVGVTSAGDHRSWAWSFAMVITGFGKLFLVFSYESFSLITKLIYIFCELKTASYILRTWLVCQRYVLFHEGA